MPFQFQNAQNPSDDEDEGYHPSSKTCPNAVRDLADRILHRALSGPPARALRGRPSLVAVLEVPGAVYVKAISDAMRRRAPNALIVPRSEKKRSSFASTDEDILRATTAGESVVGVSHDPIGLLPEVLR